jgi:hypothetical protein
MDKSSFGESNPNDSGIPDEGQENKATRVMVNTMPLGGGKHGRLAKMAHRLGIGHSNVATHDQDGKETASSGIGVDAVPHGEKERNQSEAEQKTQRQISTDEFKGGKYKNADPARLEKQINSTNQQGKRRAPYGMPITTNQGTIRPNICHTHTEEMLFDALPENEQQVIQAENAEHYEEFSKHLAGLPDKNGCMQQ